jgi:hypothetical protein
VTLYATHLPVLRAIVAAERLRRVVEFGGGEHSTSLFTAEAGAVWTVEDDAAWAETLRALFGPIPGWTLISPGTEGYTLIRDLAPDLVFVDGRADTRLMHTTSALALGTRTVVAHDTERADLYGYRWVPVFPGYTRRHYVHTSGKATTVWFRSVPVDFAPDDHTLVDG